MSDSFKLKELLDDTFEFNENGRKSSEKVENTVAKGEIGRYEQFLLFPQRFQRPVLQTHKNKGLFGTGLNETVLYIFKAFLFIVRQPSFEQNRVNPILCVQQRHVSIYVNKKVDAFVSLFKV